jgi:hypothetical protein
VKVEETLGKRNMCPCKLAHDLQHLIQCENPADFGKNLFLNAAPCQGECKRNLVASKPVTAMEVRVTSKKGAFVCEGSKKSTCSFALCQACFRLAYSAERELKSKAKKVDGQECNNHKTRTRVATIEEQKSTATRRSTRGGHLGKDDLEVKRKEKKTKYARDKYLE